MHFLFTGDICGRDPFSGRSLVFWLGNHLLVASGQLGQRMNQLATKNSKAHMFPFIESNNKHKNLLFTFFLVSQHFSYFPHRSAISINYIKSTSTLDSKPGFSLLAPQTSFLAQVGSCHQVNNLLAYQFHIYVAWLLNINYWRWSKITLT